MQNELKGLVQEVAKARAQNTELRSGMPKKPYITHKRALRYLKRDLHHRKKRPALPRKRRTSPIQRPTHLKRDLLTILLSSELQILEDVVKEHESAHARKDATVIN